MYDEIRKRRREKARRNMRFQYMAETKPVVEREPTKSITNVGAKKIDPELRAMIDAAIERKSTQK